MGILFLILLIADRVYSLVNFGFIYTDIDQTVLWNGLLDYSQGIFHEPFFYGQPYNYMLESLIAVPLYWFNIPVHMAMPVATSFLTLLPFVVLAYMFFKRQQHFWACLALSLPVLLPPEFNFLTSLSRGFVQAFLFIPVLFYPLFNPKNNLSTTLPWPIAALCFIANPSSVILTAPILIYVWSFHYRSPLFYVKALLVVPILQLDYLSKAFYTHHPERIVHPDATVGFSFETFLESLKSTDHFEHLFPLISSWGILYLLLFAALAVIAFKMSMKREVLLTVASFAFILVTFAIPKVQERHDAADIFFTPSRLYLTLPLLLIICLFLIFKNRENISRLSVPLLLLTLAFAIFKNINIEDRVNQILDGNIFPIPKNETLINRSNKLHEIVVQHNVDLMVHASMEGYEYILDTYAYNPIIYPKTKERVPSVNLYGDRRTWLYADTNPYSTILLNGFNIDSELLKIFDYTIIDKDCIVIKNNVLSIKKLFSKLNLEFKI